MIRRTFLHAAIAVCLLAPRIAESQGEPIVPKTSQAGLLAPFEESSSKVLQLAEAIPADKFSWRPIAHMRNALERLTPTDLEHPARMFGQSTNYQNVYLFGISHVHEHLGQLIAYARMNGVVPPWAGAR